MRTDSRWHRQAAWLLALWVPLGIHASTAKDFAYRYPLATDGTSAVWRIELSPAIYAVSRPAADLRDLVVVNAEGRQVPFGPAPRTPARMQAFVRKTTLLPLPANSPGGSGSVRVQRSSDGAIVIEPPSTPSAPARPGQWLVDAGRRINLDRIEIDPSALPGDARFHVSVQASGDLQHWITRGGTSEIVSVRRGADAFAQRSIAVANGTPARYYRVVLRDGDHAPWDSAQTPSVELRGSSSDTVDDHRAARQWLVALSQASTPAGGGIDYDFTLPAALPVEAAQVALGGNNTVSRYSLLDHDGNGDRVLSEGTAVHIGTGVDQATLSTFAPRRVQHLRLHTGTVLAQPPTLRVAWRPDVFVFLAEGSGPYSLLAGSHAARRADYPLATALERVRPPAAGADWRPPLAMPGAASVAGGPAALLAPKPPFEWTRLLLWLVLIGGALAVAAMAWSLLRQSRREADDR
ncbi:MAG: DUF3999 family protein [Rhodanobacter sp.]